MIFQRRLFRLAGAFLLALLLALVVAWAARARLAGQIARAYFHDHGITADIEISTLGFSGVAGRFALGPAEAPDLAARRIEIHFDPARWMPRVVGVQLVDPVVRARIDKQGQITLGKLQPWLDSLSGGDQPSPYVSPHLTVTLTGLRVLLATPAGALDVTGDVRLAENLPVLVSLAAGPATIAWRGHHMNLKAASLHYDATPGRVSVHLAAGLSDAALKVRHLTMDMRGDGLRWERLDGAMVLRLPRAHLTATAAQIAAGTVLNRALLDLTLTGFNLENGDAGLRLNTDVRVAARADTELPAPATGDTALTGAIARNLKHLDVAFQGHVRHESGQTEVAQTQLVLTAPLAARGAGGARFTLSTLTLAGKPDDLSARFDAVLNGGGLPRLNVRDGTLRWRDGAGHAAFKLAAGFDYRMLRGAQVSGAGDLSFGKDGMAFVMTSCAPVKLAQFRPGKVMAEQVSARLCPLAATPAVSRDAKGWHVRGLAQGVGAGLPLAGARLDSGAAKFDFTVPPAGGMGGKVQVRAGTIRDLAKPLRFQPVAGSGALALKDGVWRGAFAVTGKGGAKLGDVTLFHDMASGIGKAHISAPALTFTPDGLQPVDLSPLLVAFRQTRGVARFDGNVTWNALGLDSGGTLAVDGLSFLTPLGTAHGVATKLVFTSLLPPVTAPGQGVVLSRIDWTLPFSAVNVKFAFTPQTITVDSIKADFAEGHAALGGFAVQTANPGRIAGTADVRGIALSSLITASNLGSKIKLEGKVSGEIPFTAGPEGIRIKDGHITADGPGRLSINPGLWTQGGPAANAVQGFAYQALEYLAFDQLGAVLNSVPGGRLQIVFHIKGHSDPPAPQTADVPVTAILDGSALKSAVPLPSNTPIDLTLDTSLNFDELLKSYVEAWSKTLNPASARRTTP